VEVDRRRIVIPQPIRTVGRHPIEVHLHRDVRAQVTVHVEGEGETPPAVEDSSPDEGGTASETAKE
jgi:hypothetical protein